MLDEMEGNDHTTFAHSARLERFSATAAQGGGVLPSALRHAGYVGGQVTHSRRQSWSFAKAIVDDVQCSELFEMVLRPTSPTLSFVMEEVGGRVEITHGDATAADMSPGRGGKLTFLPEGCSAFGQARPMRFLRRLTIEFDLDEFERVTGQNSPRKELLRPHLMVSDERVEGICRLLADECGEPGADSVIYADSLILALMVKLSRWRRVSVSPLNRGGLAPWQLRRSQMFMLEHISEPISLQVLADLSGISLTHFSRAFKSSTGASPYQWLIASRVEKAKDYLLEKAIPIAEIAVALGFCDQAHLTRTFSKMVGATPLAWQRSRLT